MPLHGMTFLLKGISFLLLMFSLKVGPPFNSATLNNSRVPICASIGGRCNSEGFCVTDDRFFLLWFSPLLVWIVLSIMYAILVDCTPKWIKKFFAFGVAKERDLFPFVGIEKDLLPQSVLSAYDVYLVTRDGTVVGRGIATEESLDVFLEDFRVEFEVYGKRSNRCLFILIFFSLPAICGSLWWALIRALAKNTTLVGGINAFHTMEKIIGASLCLIGLLVLFKYLLSILRAKHLGAWVEMRGVNYGYFGGFESPKPSQFIYKRRDIDVTLSDTEAFDTLTCDTTSIELEEM